MAAISPDIALERGLPANLDAERFVLGAILTDELYARGDHLDRVTRSTMKQKRYVGDKTGHAVIDENKHEWRGQIP